jgi:ribosome-binding protein aMBF1 (putative translation factor)
MKKRPTFEDFKKEVFKDEKFKAEYDALGAEFDLIEKFIKARQKAHLSQAEFAERLKKQQPAIARLEGGGYTKASVETLSQIADALGYTLKITLQAKKSK